jgi:hypothetical protein
LGGTGLETPPKLSPEILLAIGLVVRPQLRNEYQWIWRNSSVSNNTISTISGQATITGLLIGAAGTATQPPFLPIQLH